MLTVMLMISCVSVLMYQFLPVWQVVAAFDVIVICVAFVFERLGEEIKEEILKEFE